MQPPVTSSSMASESESRTVHVLSQKSASLHRDTFIFWPHRNIRLLLGLNQKTTPVTSSTLQRWICLIDPMESDFELRPIAITKFGLVLYSCKPTGPALSPDSTEPLPPGDYGWFWIDGSSDYYPFPFVEAISSFEDVKKHWKQESDPFRPNALQWYAFPPSFEQSVLQRDTRCFVTGTVAASPTCSDLGVSWVFPPPWTCYMMNMKSIPPIEYVTIDNAVVLRKDLIALFHDNAFGIDVDDEYRIVIFRDLGAVTLPSRIHRSSASVGPADSFLREHFRWCLLAHVMGGDISEDYNPRSIIAAAEELGLSGDDAEMAPLNDPRWQTVVGQDLLEQHLRSELAWSMSSESDGN